MGKASRRQMTEAEVYEFHVNQVKTWHKAVRAAVKRGKRPTPESPDTDNRGGSVLAPSPHAPLIDLKNLSLGGSKPSPFGSPADSLATLSQPLLEDPAPKPHKCSKPLPSKSTSRSPLAALTQNLTGPMVEALSAPQFLDPAHSHASHSPGSVSPSDSTILRQAVRIDMLEAKQRKMEQRQHELEQKQHLLENTLQGLAERLNRICGST